MPGSGADYGGVRGVEGWGCGGVERPDGCWDGEGETGEEWCCCCCCCCAAAEEGAEEVGGERHCCGMGGVG